MSTQSIIVAIIVGLAVVSLLRRFLGFFKSKKSKGDATCGKNSCDC